jgi:release factor glutamine methyltransferase
MTRGEAYRVAMETLNAAGVEDSALDAAVLLAHALGEERARVLLAREEEIPAAAAGRFHGLVARRSRRVPVSQLTGSREFYGLPFMVTSGVLTPRPETEHLVEWALAREARTVLDIGTGSGNIAVAVAAGSPLSCVVAVDVCPAALEVARRNAAANLVQGRVTFIRSDLYSALEGTRFDLILSNPPYIREGEVEGLPPEVREHEPRHALVAGPAGTEFHRRIVLGAPGMLNPGGALGMEVGAGQAPAVAGLLYDAGFSGVKVIPDLAGTGRVVAGAWGSAHG